MTDPSPVVGGHGPHDDQPPNVWDEWTVDEYGDLHSSLGYSLTMAGLAQLWCEAEIITVDAYNGLVRCVRDAAEVQTLRDQIRGILEQVSIALGLPVTEAGHPRSNSFLFREIGKFIECHEWGWPPDEAAVLDAIRDSDDA